MASTKQIEKRKAEHLKFALSPKAQIGNPGFDRYRFIHNALPEIDFDKIDTSTAFLGKKVNYPFFISCMSGGVAEGVGMNKNLAKAAQKFGIAMGVGSQRVALENPNLAKTFQIRQYAPDIPIMANLGLVQLNYGFGLAECKRAVEMISADALVFHLNPIQEVIQPEGNRNFEKLLPKLEKIVKKLFVPVIVKEVGFGLSEDVVRRLYNIGIKIFDTAGWGGTNWAWVEDRRDRDRDRDRDRMGHVFSQWGIPTADSIKMCADFRSKLKTNHQPLITIFGSGGIRAGIDIAKAICLGADLVGIAAPFAKAALKSSGEVEKLIETYTHELKTAMFGVGAKDIAVLKGVKLQGHATKNASACRQAGPS
jgi:isopentenyl-diphosphate delta-isomerase